MPGETIVTHIQASGAIDLAIGNFGNVAAAPNSNFFPALHLVTPNLDGRIRLDELSSSYSANTIRTNTGSANINLGFVFNTGYTRPIEFDGRWLWRLQSDGFELDEENSGFDTESLLDSVAEAAADGIRLLTPQSAAIAGFVKDIPIIGGRLSAALHPTVSEGVSYDSDGSSASDYLEARGFEIITDSLVSFADFFDGSYREKDLVRLRYHTTKETNLDFQASGSQGLQLGGLQVGLSLEGQVRATPGIDFDLTFGFDFNGPFIVEGSTLSTTLNLASHLSGAVDVPGLIDASTTTDAQRRSRRQLDLQRRPFPGRRKAVSP